MVERGKEKESSGSPRLVETCCREEPRGGPRASADPRAAKDGSAYGSPRVCRVERRKWWRGEMEPAETGTSGVEIVFDVEVVVEWNVL